MRTFCLLVALGLGGPTAAGGEWRVYPSEIPLAGPRAAQQLLVLEVEGDRALADQTSRATIVSSNPYVAAVVEGRVTAVGNGEAILTAKIAQRPVAMARVRVQKADAAAATSFTNQIVPAMTRAGCNSGACHGALAGKGGMKLSLRGYDPDADHFAITRQALGRRVDFSKPEQSLLILKAVRAMPHGGGRRLVVDESDYNLVLDWVKQGAPGPTGKDARLERIEVWPRAALLAPTKEMQVIVRAVYSDGAIEDVTRWSRFGSSDEDVAKVSEEGKITVAGHGEAAITVGFGTAFSALTVTSPYVNRLEEVVFTQAPVRNRIDELVLKKLQNLHIPPSPVCTDQEFIRRAYLDAAGILPTPAEVESFLSDKAANRREKLIDRLLERSEYVDYWSYKWSDLLLVSTRKLPQPAMWSFYRTVRQAVADNKPWDEFARTILTANGSTLTQGGGNFFVLHKDTAELTESIAVTFLGMSVTCARCHNHPLEKWTQDQYWSMANLFARVGMKNGDRAGEVIVFEKPAGDVLHPRRQAPMPPTPLDGVAIPLDDPRDRRAYFVDWLTARENPYFARAVVNRVWKNFMGRGLVEAEDDLRETNPPSNRELFDAVTADFVEHGFDVKRLARSIMNSAAYQRSSSKIPGNEQDNRYYSRYLVRRLPGEVILDCLSQVTAAPTSFNLVYTGVEGNTKETSNYPIGTRALQLPDSRVASRFLDAFGRPDRSAVCSCERQQDATVGQALMMNNGQALNEKLRSKTSRIDEWLSSGLGDERAVVELFMLAFSRKPTAAELKKCLASFENAPLAAAKQRREVMEDLFWAVLSTSEFLFNH